MDIVFKKSAFEHELTKSDIRRAFLNPYYKEFMETMTKEEAFALDKHYTKNPPKVNPAKARIRIPMVRIDDITAKSAAPRRFLVIQCRNIKAAQTAYNVTVMRNWTWQD